MNSKELKSALMDGSPVLHGGIEYSCVSAIIYRVKNGEIVVSAELLDKNKNCVVIAPMGKIQEVQGDSR